MYNLTYKTYVFHNDGASSLKKAVNFLGNVLFLSSMGPKPSSELKLTESEEKWFQDNGIPMTQEAIERVVLARGSLEENQGGKEPSIFTQQAKDGIITCYLGIGGSDEKITKPKVVFPNIKIKDKERRGETVELKPIQDSFSIYFLEGRNSSILHGKRGSYLKEEGRQRFITQCEALQTRVKGTDNGTKYISQGTPKRKPEWVKEQNNACSTCKWRPSNGAIKPGSPEYMLKCKVSSMKQILIGCTLEEKPVWILCYWGISGKFLINFINSVKLGEFTPYEKVVKISKFYRDPKEGLKIENVTDMAQPSFIDEEMKVSISRIRSGFISDYKKFLEPHNLSTEPEEVEDENLSDI